MIIAKTNPSSANFSSRFQIGDKVLFQPNLELISMKGGTADPQYAAKAEIARVSFSASKVYYDIDVLYVETYAGSSTTFRTRLTDIPSDMICL